MVKFDENGCTTTLYIPSTSIILQSIQSIVLSMCFSNGCEFTFWVEYFCVTEFPYQVANSLQKYSTLSSPGFSGKPTQTKGKEVNLKSSPKEAFFIFERSNFCKKEL